MKHICEYCNSEHNGEYATGRFCSNKCARGFSTKDKRKEINEKVSKTINSVEYKEKYSRIYKRDSTKWSSKQCLNCETEYEYRISQKTKFCCFECYKQYYKSLKSEKRIYTENCYFDFNIYDYPSEFDIELLKQRGLYSPINKKNNPNGVSRDHIVSISHGYKNNISAEIIKHPANCKLILNKHNQEKHSKCGLTIKELNEKIIIWDKKYKAKTV